MHDTKVNYTAKENFNKKEESPRKSILGLDVIPKNLQEVQKSQPKKENNPKEEIVIEAQQINKNINITQNDFVNALEMTISLLQQRGNATGSVILQQFPSQIQHNKWHIKLPSEVHRQTLERERDLIIPFMRNMLNVDSLFWEISIDLTLSPKQKILSGAREIFAEMLARNPALITIEQIFKTRIID